MAKKLRGQTATIEAEESDSGDIITLGVLDNPEVAAPEQEVQELRGAGSTEWQDIQKTATSATVSGEVAEYDLDAWDRLVNYAEAAGKLDDSPEVKTFILTVEFEASDGSTKSITAGPGYVDGSIPIGGGREEWIGLDLEFVCRTISDITNTDAAVA